MQGVCCTCQSLQELDTIHDEGLELDIYVMASHIIWGEYCEGAGTIPQAIVDNES